MLSGVEASLALLFSVAAVYDRRIPSALSSCSRGALSPRRLPTPLEGHTPRVPNFPFAAVSRLGDRRIPPEMWEAPRAATGVDLVGILLSRPEARATLAPVEDIPALLRSASERQLPFLVIGAHAIVSLGFVRNTLDLDLLVPERTRSGWLNLLRELGYRFFHGVAAFAQFEPPNETGVPIDLMFVDEATWQKLAQGALETDLGGVSAPVPRPEHLVALKLHAALSPTRTKPESDWEDIKQIVRLCGLDPKDESFRALIVRYGGQDGLARIEQFTN